LFVALGVDLSLIKVIDFTKPALNYFYIFGGISI
jgi:hypothetical protein